MIEAIVVAALLLLVLLVYVAAPLRGGPRRDAEPATELAEDAGARKRSALSGLVDIEGEREIGKLSQADFEVLRAEYEAEALAALNELDSLAITHTSDDELESEVREMKKRFICPTCGAVRTPGGACSNCQTKQ
jgi:hypothetical protein